MNKYESPKPSSKQQSRSKHKCGQQIQGDSKYIETWIARPNQTFNPTMSGRLL